jgi:redox-sensitive bicupin YhaK (pirin superfamily)
MKTLSQLVIRKSEERGHAEHGWLDSRHTFSFGEYHVPAHMGFRSLRVINEDRVAPASGFPRHPHRDMEIFSYVLEGALAHKDSLGNSRVLRPGQVQLMSAGRGVLHEEANPSDREPVHFLQIWIEPASANLQPRYTEWHPSPTSETEKKILIISPDGRDGSAVIAQKADVYRVRLKNGQSVSHELGQGRGAWLQIMRGAARLNGEQLNTGDGASTEEPGTLAIEATQDMEALLFDLG